MAQRAAPACTPVRPVTVPSAPATCTAVVSVSLNVLEHSEAHRDAVKDANGPAACGACGTGSVSECEGLGHTHDISAALSVLRLFSLQ